MSKLLFKAVGGSRLYGTSLENSDIDYVEVVFPDVDKLIGLGEEKNKFNSSNTEDVQKYTLRGFIRLLLKSNPNVLELLFATDVLVEQESFKELRKNYDKFVSKQLYKPFIGFVRSQIYKSHEKIARYEELERIMQILKDSRVISRDLSERIYKAIGKRYQPGSLSSEVYKKIGNIHDEYGKRVVENVKIGYDPKFLYHSIRVLWEAKQLLLKGYIEFPIEPNMAEFLMAIRRAELSLDDIMGEYYFLVREVEESFRKTNLPEKPDFEFANKYLIKSHLEWLCKK